MISLSPDLIWASLLFSLFSFLFILFGLLFVANFLNLLILHLQKIHASYLHLTFSQYRSYIDAVNTFVAAAAGNKIDRRNRKGKVRDDEVEEEDDFDFDVGEEPDSDPDIDPDFNFDEG